MYRNLKSFDFIITAGIFVYSAWSLLEMSVDVCATLEKLALFAWGIIGCMRIDKKNRKKQNEDAQLCTHWLIKSIYDPIKA